MVERCPPRLLTAAMLCTALAGCKPPPTDEAAVRAMPETSVTGPSLPIQSPETQDALWVPSQIRDRIIYGQPGNAPMMALACERFNGSAIVRLTRYAAADEGAGAFVALIGNGHVARLPVDATAHREGFVWEGIVAADNADLDVLTGRKVVAATLPGAGKLTLNPSSLPGFIIEKCRRGDNGSADLKTDELIEESEP